MLIQSHLRTPIAVAAVLTLLAANAGPALAEADGPDFFRVVGVAPDDVLNIRAEPGPHAEKIGEIPPDGSCIRNLGCRGGLTFEEYSTLSPDEQAARINQNPRWCRVEYQGTTGWAAGPYLAEGVCQ